MNKIKEIKLDNTNWIEVTFVDENDKEIHCESFSGHKEHIALLRAKAKEFNTSLDEYTELIQLCEDSFIYPTDEEIEKEELQHKINEATQYLKDTDWVSDYKLRHDLGLEIIPEDSSKWAMIAKREEYILFLKGVKNA